LEVALVSAGLSELLVASARLSLSRQKTRPNIIGGFSVFADHGLNASIPATAIENKLRENSDAEFT
jgi:hypothetical protein